MGYVITTSYNELHHHGILGQRWGVRRYQNPDGSLTPTGKIRYKNGKVSEESSTEHMTDQEIREAVNRMQLEQQYNNLKKSSVTKGKKYAEEFGAATVSILVTGAALKFGTKYIEKITEVAASKAAKKTVEVASKVAKKVAKVASDAKFRHDIKWVM